MFYKSQLEFMCTSLNKCRLNAAVIDPCQCAVGVDGLDVLEGIPAAESAAVLRLGALAGYFEGVMQSGDCAGIVEAQVIIVAAVAPVPTAVIAGRPLRIGADIGRNKVRQTGSASCHADIHVPYIVSVQGQQPRSRIVQRIAYAVCVAGRDALTRRPHIRHGHFAARYCCACFGGNAGGGYDRQQ